MQSLSERLTRAADLFVQLVRRRCTLDPLAFGGELALGLRLLLLQHGEGIIQPRQRGRCRVYDALQLMW